MAQNPSSNSLPFGKKNYLVMGISIALIGLGYFLMSKEKFVDATQFSVSLYICPFLIVAGLVGVGWGIMLRSGDSPAGKEDTQA